MQIKFYLLTDNRQLFKKYINNLFGQIEKYKKEFKR